MTKRGVGYPSVLPIPGDSPSNQAAWPIALSAPARNPGIIRAQALASGGAETLPEDLAPRRQLRRLLQVAALVGVLVLVVLLAELSDDIAGRRRHALKLST